MIPGYVYLLFALQYFGHVSMLNATIMVQMFTNLSFPIVKLFYRERGMASLYACCCVRALITNHETEHINWIPMPHSMHFVMRQTLTYICQRFL